MTTDIDSGATPEAIDTSDAASSDGPPPGTRGGRTALLILGPFLLIWLAWWRLGDVLIHRGKDSVLPDWVQSVPNDWTVSWFDFAGRSRAGGRHKASGWVNTWFDHLRYEEVLQFSISWHLAAAWIVVAVAVIGFCGYRAWTLRQGRWLAAGFGAAWGGWSLDLFDWAALDATSFAYLLWGAAAVVAFLAWRDREFTWAAAATLAGAVAWVTTQEPSQSFNARYAIRRIAGWLEAPLDISEGLFISGYELQFGDFPWLGDREWLHLGVLPWYLVFGVLIAGGARMAWQRRSGAWTAGTLFLGWYAFVGFYEPWNIPALPWVVIAGLFGVAGWKLGGWKLALLGAGFIVYASFIGEPPAKEGAETRWDKTMITLSAVLVSVPIAAAIGGVLGVVAAKRRRVEQLLIPVLNLTQAMPHFTFMIPIGVFVGVSHKAGVIATIAYAVPPMARLTILGIQGISKEVIEAGVMSGCTPRQMLWKVELPAARHALLVGINQVVMECLAMVVIASFVGTAGLGQDLLFRLTGLEIGSGVEIGIAIVVMAIALDRLSQALGNLQPVHHDPGVPFWERHPYLLASGAVIAVGAFMANTWDAAQRVPKSWMRNHLRQATDWFVDNALVWSVHDWFAWLRWHLDDKIILPVKDIVDVDNALILAAVALCIAAAIDGLRRVTAVIAAADTRARVSMASAAVIVVVGFLTVVGDNRLGVIQSAITVGILAGLILLAQRVAVALTGASDEAAGARRFPYLLGALAAVGMGLVVDLVLNTSAVQNADSVIRSLAVVGLVLVIAETARRAMAHLRDAHHTDDQTVWQQHPRLAGLVAAFAAVVVIGSVALDTVRANLGGTLQIAVVAAVIGLAADLGRRSYGLAAGGTGRLLGLGSIVVLLVGTVVFAGMVIDGPVSSDADGLKVTLIVLTLLYVCDTLRRGTGVSGGRALAGGPAVFGRFPTLVATATTVVTVAVGARILDSYLAGATSTIVTRSQEISLFQTTMWFRDHLELWVLLPMRDAFYTIPWVAAVLLLFLVGRAISGIRLGLLAGGLFAFIALSGFWDQAMFSLYQLTFAVLLAAAIGVPFGIWAAASDRRNSVVQVFLDGFQTFPSFVYLLPAIMFFSVSETAVIFAVVMSVGVPAIRYTIFGIRNIPHHLVEAATMSGCTKRQTLWKVKVPLAVPEIMLGINQTIMFGLFMVMIGGLIKTGGLARELIEAQPNVDSGRAIIAGVCVAAIGMAVDLLISEWADRRKKQLGLIEA